MRIARPVFSALLPALILLQLGSAAPPPRVQVFAHQPSAEPVLLISLRNAAGLEVSFMTWGATLIDVVVPDRHGKFENVNLRLATSEDYFAGHPNLGSSVGRFANRIANGGFTIHGKRFDLSTVNPQSGIHIHGGKTGFQHQNWILRETWTEPTASGAVLTLLSPDGHEGYPGEVQVTARISLDQENRLSLLYEATTSHATHVNLTNHAYWNLGGVKSGPVLSHHLQLASSHILEFDLRKIPTGRRLPVAGTPFDFRESRPIGARIDETPPGYDHCFVLNQGGDDQPAFAARLVDPRSGRVMEVHTNAPGLQLYSGNYLKTTLIYEDHPYGPHHGICLECQHFPDTPNHPDFPSTLLLPGQTYRSIISHQFSTVSG